MQGKDFLAVAKRLVKGSTEADWRTTAGRAYYALLLEARTAFQRWAIPIPRRDQLHSFIRLRFTYASDPEFKQFGYTMERLNELRNFADYQIEVAGRFATVRSAEQSILDAEDALAFLDQIESDPVRRAAAVAALKP